MGENYNSCFNLWPRPLGLHLDDLPLLESLRDKFQCGSITIDQKNHKANYVISSQEALLGVLVPIFDSFHLNTTKYLNYLAFREVVMMRTTKALAVTQPATVLQDLMYSLI